MIAAVQAAFAEASWSRVLESLDTYGVESREPERDRVQAAIVNLSRGSEEKLGAYVAAAKHDYRDVLLWSEYPEQAKMDDPEKRERVAALFARLGIKPPNWGTGAGSK